MESDTSALFLKIKKEDVLKVKDDLIRLYDWELTARGVYFQEMRKFDGEIFETIKWLYEQEEWHTRAIGMLLNKANIIVKEHPVDVPKLSSDSNTIIQMDVDFEHKTVVDYKKTAAKTSGAVKEILLFIMQEEIRHVDRLEAYLKK